MPLLIEQHFLKFDVFFMWYTLCDNNPMLLILHNCTDTQRHNTHTYPYTHIIIINLHVKLLVEVEQNTILQT